jgi:gliding motility-associated-like protein
LQQFHLISSFLLKKLYYSNPMNKIFPLLKKLFVIFLLINASLCKAQDSIFVVISGGDLYSLDINNCTSNFIGKTNGSFGDIAITPNGILWGISSGILYKINPQTADTTIIGQTGKSGVTLVELNDTILLMEFGKDLYKIDTRTAVSTLVGNIGYQAAGDLTWMDNDLFMISAGILIKIELDALVTKINKVTPINNSSNLLPNCEGLVSAEFDNEYNYIIGFSADDVYKICPIDGSYVTMCNNIVPNGIPGGAAKRLKVQNPLPKNCSKPNITGIVLKSDTCSNSEKSFEFIGSSGSSYFKWQFGDSGSGNLDTITYFGLNPKPFPKHFYNKPGKYEVCIEYFEQNKVLSLCDTFTFVPCCKASIEISSKCIDDDIQFKIVGDSGVQMVEWEIENKRSGFKTIKQGSVFSEKFSDSGTYFVKAKINSKCGYFEIDSIYFLAFCNKNDCNNEILTSGLCENEFIEFYAKSNEEIKSVLWKFGDSLNKSSNSIETIFIYKAGKYVVTCIVETKCGFDTLYKNIEIIDCLDPKYNLCKMYLPNAITPNNDPINQYFEPWSMCPPTVYQLKIFNRWGEILFESNNPNIKWDGMYKGEPVESSMYYYIFTYKFEKYKEITEHGYIQLIR